MSRAHGRKAALIAALVGLLLLLLVSATSASAAVGPQWRLEAYSNTTVAPGDELRYYAQAKNVGDAATDGSEIAWRVELPAGIAAKSAASTKVNSAKPLPCGGGADGKSPVFGASTVVCREDSTASPGDFRRLSLLATVDPGASGTLVAHFEVSGGGAPTVTTVDPVAVAAQPPPFGIDAFDASLAADASGAVLTRAAAHPYDYTTALDFNTLASPDPLEGDAWPVEPPRAVAVDLPAGLVANPTIVDACTTTQLLNGDFIVPRPLCPPSSQVGVIHIRFITGGEDGVGGLFSSLAVFNMVPPPGAAGRVGFNILGTLITLDARLRQGGDYGLVVGTTIPQGLEIAGNTISFWGAPSAAAHDHERACPGQLPPPEGPTCPSGAGEEPFFRLPTSCSEVPADGRQTTIRLDSWADPGDFVTDSVKSHEPLGHPYPRSQWGDEVGVTGCEEVPVQGSLEAKPTTRDVESASGLNVHVEVPNPGLRNKDGIASSDIEAVEVTLPRGLTINPSQAEGLGVCTPAQYESTELSFHPTEKGCPEGSKIGKVEVETPLLHEKIPGDVYIAQQDDPTTTMPGAENPFDSLLAIYIVLHNEQRGILVKLPGEVTTDETTGRIVTSFENLPQLPFDSFDFHFREGARAPLVTPPVCGIYTTVAEITGHSDPGNPIVSKSSFQVDRGIGGGPCPSGGIPPFKPGFSAGSLNPSAGLYSPFTMRLTRNDGEQDLTKFSSVLPPGVVAKLAGVEKCSDAAIAAAKGKTGREELAAPSCPAGSEIGRTLAGAGVGSVLTYVPGKLYLAGPYNGAPLSVVAITPAVAGPFDVGAVVVRQALSLDPKTAEVHVDGDRSDPIPHILEGIPLKLRDLRVYVDRESFTINPTSCDPMQVGATLFGSYADVFNPGDDVPVALASRYQAANCASLGFKPRLRINLRGARSRGGFPGLKAVLTPRPGDANLGRVAVVLPRSAFLEQGHIRTICTRVQYAAGAGHGAECPKASAYGYVRAWTPLLDEPLQGPVFLRSSDNKLPDMVLALRGLVDIEEVARIDSVPLGGGDFGIRSVFAAVPDAPLSRVVLTMQGGKKGLIVNSRNLCAAKNRARVKLDAHNGKVRDFEPVVRPDCGKPRKARAGHSAGSRARP